MNIRLPQRRAAILLLTATIMVGGAVAAHAHSTKGRIKIPLKKAVLSIDDVAYFVESYVHRRLYKDRFARSKRRFYVKEFVQVDQNGSRAEIRFIVLDMKNHATFTDAMNIYRGEGGIWRYRPGNESVPVELYTYVMKWGYYYQRYMIPVSAAGIVIAVVFLVWLRIRNRKKGESTCEV